jgi:glycosyltransferase involved in cell wall biosynthesis
MRKVKQGDKLNILVFPTHERYEHNLCQTGHNFYSLNIGKGWERAYSEVPENYHLIDSIPEYVDFDLILGHTSCERLEIAHDLISETQKSPVNKLSIPVLRHSHVLPDVRFDTEQQIQQYQSIPVDRTSFISNFNRNAWGFDESNSSVIEHGIDTDFWKPSSLEHEELLPKTNDVCLSVVNDWPNRDWCCGFDLWRQTTQGLPVKVLGHSPGLSEAAESVEHLREEYRSSRLFYNTSLHSPVPTVLMEAMACGCAIVSTATCMIPEIIEHGKNGLISNDPNELRGFLEMLLKDKDLANKLGQEARKTICEKYNLQSFVDNWNNLFYDTIENYTDVMEVSNENISQSI